MSDSLQEAEGKVPKRKEKGVLPEGKGRVIKCGKPTELCTAWRRQRVKKDMGFGNGAPLRTTKMQATQSQILPSPVSPAPLTSKTRAWHKGNTIFERMACSMGHENSRTDSEDPGYPEHDEVECKMPTIVHSSHKEAECFPRSPFASGWESVCFGQWDIGVLPWMGPAPLLLWNSVAT